MAYTTIKKPSDYFNTVLYAGNSGTQSITGVNFQPDFLWIKRRTLAGDHNLVDVIRTSDKTLISNATSAEYSNATITSFDSDGFSLSGTDGALNASGSNYVAWNWLSGGTGVSNTQGSIASTVSANTTSGFSVVSYAGTGANATVGHGLGVAPAMIILKNRTSGAEQWHVLHKSLNTTGGQYLLLSDTSAVLTNSVVWNSTAPTSSVFSIGTAGGVNGSGNNLIAYCFAEKKGFSKFGSYTGNGSATDGTFVYTGFKPAFIIIKGATNPSSWLIQDNKRQTYNDGSIPWIKANTNDAEFNLDNLDMLSNGFKCRTSNNDFNGANTYIYMAFAEQPLVGDNPATAR